MQARFRVGEKVGPFVVVSDTFIERANGTFVETMKDSGGNQRVTVSQPFDTSFRHVMDRRPIGRPVLVPYTVRHPATVKGVAGQHATWVDVSGSPVDYWRLLCDWWVPEDLTIIEHDVEARPGIFERFGWCPEPWCYFRYSNHTDANAAAWHFGILGCTRFRRQLIAAVPDAVTGLDERWRDWHEMSTGLGMTLREAGYEPHVHEPPVDHHRMMDVGGVVAAMGQR